MQICVPVRLTQLGACQSYPLGGSVTGGPAEPYAPPPHGPCPFPRLSVIPTAVPPWFPSIPKAFVSRSTRTVTEVLAARARMAVNLSVAESTSMFAGLDGSVNLMTARRMPAAVALLSPTQIASCAP
jgi:hypothetical protein